MAFCTKCGTQVADGTAFCTKCGAPMAAAGYQQPPQQYPPQGGYQQPPAGYQQPGYPQQPVYQQQAAGSTGLQENVAGLLCYLVGLDYRDHFPDYRQAAVREIPCGAVHCRIRGNPDPADSSLVGLLQRLVLRRGFGFMSWGLGTMLMGVLGLAHVHSLDSADDQGLPGRDVPRPAGETHPYAIQRQD